MTRKLSRRQFIETAGIGVAATAVLTGCGPSSRYVVREPYTRMPEYTYNGQSTYYATTCRECPAGCGTIIRTEQGRALKVEGNPNHPVNLGKTCARGQAALQGLYNPDRIQDPVQQVGGRGSGNFSKISWDEAITTVQATLQNTPPSQIAYLLGLTPNHLFDLVSEICAALGAPPPIQFGTHEIYDTQLTLLAATQKLFETTALPYFDLANADVTFSFGANFLETYLSPMAFSRGYAQMRRGKTGQRGYLVQFEPRLSQTGASADEWIPVAPGSQGLVALGIGRLIAEMRGQAIPAPYVGVDLQQISKSSGISVADMQRLANLFVTANHPLAIPGSSTSAMSNGLEATQAVLALNAVAGNLGLAGGLYLSQGSPIHPEFSWLPNSMADMHALIGKMRAGEIKALFIHGTNPVYEWPNPAEFTAALQKVPQVFSFASFPDETSLQADFILPDHTALESWGYQKVVAGADRRVISGFQPVVTPFFNTKATSDVLLASVQAIGGDLANSVPYQDEVQYLESALVNLVTEQGFFNAPEIKTFMVHFQQYGGWWDARPHLDIPQGSKSLSLPLPANPGKFDGGGDYYLMPFMSPILGDGSGANKPWLQEIPDPMTTVMWNSWVEINPETADILGIADDDIVRIISPTNSFEAIVYRYPAIRLDTIAIPFGQGHSAYGRYAEHRGVNPHYLLSMVLNGADELALGATKVIIEKTGRKQKLSRLESRLGVYGSE